MGLMVQRLDPESVTRLLEGAGCVAAAEEARELIIAANGSALDLQSMVSRRLTGEPLAWITGAVTFCELQVLVEPRVYVPRSQSEALARMASTLVPAAGIAVDLCTGTGAIAMVLRSAAPSALIVGTELDPRAADCARKNGIVVYQGNLDEPLPEELVGRVDVMTGVLPYVPTQALHLLSRDVQRFEPRMALDGGEAGLRFISDVVQRSPRWLRAGGWLLLELGGDQARRVGELFTAGGYVDVGVMEDDEADVRGIYGRMT